MDFAYRGTRVVYVLGNHDEAVGFMLGHRLGGVEITHEAAHELADGRRLWLVHGDLFDPAVLYYPAMTRLGGRVYEVLARVNAWLRPARVWLGYPRFSLADYLHGSLTRGAAVERFERAVITAARRRGYDGVVCGHNHRPDHKTVDGTLYLNCGDGVSSCTALVEAEGGEISHVRW
jgi:UDP-2,3-diacylglucosamine pyrophosphatase LpxH